MTAVGFALNVPYTNKKVFSFAKFPHIGVFSSCLTPMSLFQGPTQRDRQPYLTPTDNSENPVSLMCMSRTVGGGRCIAADTENMQTNHLQTHWRWLVGRGCPAVLSDYLDETPEEGRSY